MINVLLTERTYLQQISQTKDLIKKKLLLIFLRK